MPTATPERSARLLAAAALVVCALGCRSTGERCRPIEGRAGRVVVLGVDSLHLPLLDQLVAEGTLPNFARLYREGTVGGVSTLAAGLPSLSPIIWTTFATGQLKDRHGIVGWARKDRDGQRWLVSSRERKAAALWEIASACGERVGVVNWPVTFPAERVNGFVISDRYLSSFENLGDLLHLKVAQEAEGLVHPAELASALAAVQVPAQQPGFVTPEIGEGVDRSVLSLAYAALAEHPVDLLMIYTRSLDDLSHVWWHTHEPLPGEKPAEDRIVAFIRRYDGILGELLDRLAPEDHLVVLSDHGMERKQDAGLPGQHVSARTAVGVLMWWGPGVPAGRRVSASLLDVAPTILELLGIPPSKDMPGAVLASVFPPQHPFISRRRTPYVRLDRLPRGGRASPADEKIIDRLRALGYVE